MEGPFPFPSETSKTLLLETLKSSSRVNGECITVLKYTYLTKERNFVIIESKNITVDNIVLTSLSDDFQARLAPYLLSPGSLTAVRQILVTLGILMALTHFTAMISESQ